MVLFGTRGLRVYGPAHCGPSVISTQSVYRKMSVCGLCVLLLVNKEIKVLKV